MDDDRDTPMKLTTADSSVSTWRVLSIASQGAGISGLIFLSISLPLVFVWIAVDVFRVNGLSEVINNLDQVFLFALGLVWFVPFVPLYFIVVCWVSWPLIWAVRTSFSKQLTPLGTAVCIGGLTGWIGFFPLGIFGVSNQLSIVIWHLALLVGSFGGLKMLRHADDPQLHLVLESNFLPDSWSFGIKELMLATAWCAGILVVSRLTGRWEFTWIVVNYLVVQGMCLWSCDFWNRRRNKTGDSVTPA